MCPLPTNVKRTQNAQRSVSGSQGQDGVECSIIKTLPDDIGFPIISMLPRFSQGL